MDRSKYQFVIDSPVNGLVAVSVDATLGLIGTVLDTMSQLDDFEKMTIELQPIDYKESAV